MSTKKCGHLKKNPAHIFFIALNYYKSYINGYFLGATILINYASTIFIEAVIISFILQFAIKFIYKRVKYGTQNKRPTR